MAILVEFNVSCNIGAGQLSDRVPPYVYRMTNVPHKFSAVFFAMT